MLTSATAQVQTPPPRPPVTQPGQIERQFQRPPEPSAKPGAISIPDAGQKPPENADSISILVTQLTVDGSTTYSQDALRAVYSNVLNREVSLTEIYRLVERLTARYRNDGYILSQVYVPAQTVENGVIHLQAVEGYIADVRVEGGSDSLRKRVRNYAEKIRATRPLTMAALERYVLLVNDLPGVAAHAVLAPSAVPGASDLVLQLAKRPVDGSFGSDNRGSRVQGPARMFGDLDFDSALGGTARTQLRAVSTLDSQLTYVALSRDQYVGSEGGIIGVAGSY